MKFTEYKYKVKMNWLSNGEELEIDPNNIINLVIDRKYSYKNHSVIYVVLSASKALYNMIILEKEDAEFTLETLKYEINRNESDWEESAIEETCMPLDKYKYIVLSDSAAETNEQHAVKKDDEDPDETPRDIYHNFTVALIKKENYNNNKILINKVYRGITPSDLILKYTSSFPLVLEQPTYNAPFDELIIPPITSVCTLFKYVNSIRPFYDTPYRFFMDFDKAYMLSSKGTPIKLKGDIVENIVFYITDYAEMDNRIPGEVREEPDTVELYVNRKNMRLYIDQIDDMVLNSGYIADFLGDTSNIKYTKGSDKYEFLRCMDPEFKDPILNNRKNRSKLSDIKVTITKADIDVSVITPNKNIVINNYEPHMKYDGRFVLTSKKEVYVREGPGFRCLSTMSFTKL